MPPPPTPSSRSIPRHGSSTPSDANSRKTSSGSAPASPACMLAFAMARKPQEREERHRELAEPDREIHELKAIRSRLPTCIRAADLPEDKALHSLPVGQRLLHDIVRMIACRAETSMMQPFIAGPGKGRSTRKLCRALLTSDADIIPKTRIRMLRVRFPALGSDACERELVPLIDELNQTRTRYPGTDLMLTYEMPRSAEQLIVTEIGLVPDV